MEQVDTYTLADMLDSRMALRQLRTLTKEELIPQTVPEGRVWLWQLVWHEVPPPDLVLRWSHGRRQHQARAQRYHYRHRARAG